LNNFLIKNSQIFATAGDPDCIVIITSRFIMFASCTWSYVISCCPSFMPSWNMDVDLVLFWRRTPLIERAVRVSYRIIDHHHPTSFFSKWNNFFQWQYRSLSSSPLHWPFRLSSEFTFWPKQQIMMKNIAHKLKLIK